MKCYLRRDLEQLSPSSQKHVAETLTRANLPEYCKRKISDMAQLHDVMTS